MVDPDDTLSGYLRKRADKLPDWIYVSFRVLMFLGGLGALFVPVILELAGVIHGEAGGASVGHIIKHGLFFLAGLLGTMIGLFGPFQTVEFFGAMPWEKLLRRK